LQAERYANTPTKPVQNRCNPFTVRTSR
jgi:hypothetical protein